MKTIFQRSFWGFILLLLGVLFFLREVFHIDIPIGGLFWSILLIVVGLSLISRPRSNSLGGDQVVFDDAKVVLREDRTENSAIFSQADFDGRKLKGEDAHKPIKVNSIFAGSTLRIKKDQPIKIVASAVFGEVALPDGRSVSFGERTYYTSGYSTDKSYILLVVNAVFGSLEIVEED